MAKTENKPILMHFTGSDWCPYCIQMEKQVYSKNEFLKFARQNLILLKLDFPSRKRLPPETAEQNRVLQQKYGVRGFPTCVLISPDGEELCRIAGFRKLADFLPELKIAVSRMKR